MCELRDLGLDKIWCGKWAGSGGTSNGYAGGGEEDWIENSDAPGDGREEWDEEELEEDDDPDRVGHVEVSLAVSR